MYILGTKGSVMFHFICQQCTRMLNRYLFQTPVLQTQIQIFEGRSIAVVISDLTSYSCAVLFKENNSGIQILPLTAHLQSDADVVIEGTLLDLASLSDASTEDLSKVVTITGDMHLMLALRKILLDKNSGVDIFINQFLGDKTHFLIRIFWQQLKLYWQQATDGVHYSVTESNIDYRCAVPKQSYASVKTQLLVLQKRIGQLTYRVNQLEH